jgi:hypothetical protein
VLAGSRRCAGARPQALSCNLAEAPICALPIALFALALSARCGRTRTWGARLYAVGPTAKLLVLPLLFYHFERSTRGMWVFIAFLVSCTLLMAMSWIVAFDPGLRSSRRRRTRHLRQELHRPEPGIRACARGAGLSDHHAAAEKKNLAGGGLLTRSR